MRRSLRVFLSIILSLLTGWFFFLGQRLITSLPISFRVQLCLWAILAIPFLNLAWIPLIYWRRRVRQNPQLEDPPTLAWGYQSLALLSFVFFCVVLRDLIKLVAIGIHFTVGYSAPFTPLLYSVPATSLLVVIALVMLFLGRLNAKGPPRIREIDVPIRDLPPSLEGFRMAQLSDIHIGRTIGADFVQRVVERVNELKVDLIAITGDLVDGTVEDLRSHLGPLSQLSSREGVFYVTGNHEYYWNAPAWIEEVKRLGMKPLLNSHQVVEREKNKLVIAGVPDLWASRMGAGEGPNPSKALAGAPSADVRVLLAHQPKSAHTSGAENFDLQLSGHTHGGQFLPWTFFIHLFQPFVRGLNRYQNRWIYVNRGTGYWGPPVRLGSPSEITLLKLTRAN
jgi:predicted MPP superfamily phosphohydrolase